MNKEELIRERDFHNERFSHEKDPRSGLQRWYAAVRHCAERQNRLVIEYSRGNAVLEYGCADGKLSLSELKLPVDCRHLTGIDISDVAIEKAREKASELGMSVNVDFLAMNAEAMTFNDASFDLVFGRGIVHHLTTETCFSEVARVLRPGGVAIFCEPLAYNPFLNIYRWRTPNIRTPDEHPLRWSDFNLAGQYFARVDTEFYGLFSVAGAFLDSRSSGIIYRVCKGIDSVVLRIPLVKWLAWQCLIICRKE